MNSMWVNLPVKDIQKTREFYEKLGLEVRTMEDGTMLSVTYPEGGIFMFIQEDWFETSPGYSYIGSPNETLFSVSVSNEDELDELLDLVMDAGGRVTVDPKIFRGYLGAEFDDINGFHFNVIVM